MHFFINGKYGPLLGAALGLFGSICATIQMIREGHPPLNYAITIAAATFAGFVLGSLFWVFDAFSGTTICKRCGGRIWPNQLLCKKCYKAE